MYGSRFLNLEFKLFSRDRTIMPLHYLGNRFLTGLTNLLYGAAISDMETGYKAFTRKAAQSLRLRSKRFEFEVELTAKLLKGGWRIAEVPIRFHHPRTFQEGKKITVWDGVLAAFALVKYRLGD